MWIMLNDCFLSIVSKDCQRDSLLVRARRKGDIEKIFPKAQVQRSTNTDYLYRAIVTRAEIKTALCGEIDRITYSNFKDSVQDQPLHDAYLRVWTAMASLQPLKPYSYGIAGPNRQLMDFWDAPVSYSVGNNGKGSAEEDAHVFATGHMPPDTSHIPETPESWFQKAKVKVPPHDSLKDVQERIAKNIARKAKKRSLKKGR